MGDDLFGDPELAALGQRFRDELRAEAAEYEELAAKDILRSRGLGDVALELLHRGDVVGVALGGRAFTGTVTYAAGDLLCLRTPSLDVDLSLRAPLALQVVERVRAGGQARGRGPGSFLGRLRELEMALTPVELWCPALDLELRGPIVAVADDHVVIEGSEGQRWFVAREAVACVLTSRHAAV
jgi:hypothetical protein